jgi:mRNA interferase RelE/StbE
MPSLLFGLVFGPAATAFLDKMPPGKIRVQIAGRAKGLITDRYPSGCKKLKGMTHGNDPVWRVRQGDYRILYVVRQNPPEVVVINIDHRKDVYR